MTAVPAVWAKGIAAALLLLLPATLGGAGPVAASSETRVGGILTADTTWGPSGGTYVVDSTVQIPAGMTLTIQPGTRIETNVYGIFLVAGNLQILGEASAKVSVSSRTPNGRANLYTLANLSSTTDHRITVAHADLSGVDTRLDGREVSVTDSTFDRVSYFAGYYQKVPTTLVVERTTVMHTPDATFELGFSGQSIRFRDNHVWGPQLPAQFTARNLWFSMGSGGATIEGNVFGHVPVHLGASSSAPGPLSFTGNTLVGDDRMLVGTDAEKTIRGNAFLGGTTIFSYPQISPGDLSGNWWGTQDVEKIHERLTDASDDVNYPYRINVEPVLASEPPGLPPRPADAPTVTSAVAATPNEAQVTWTPGAERGEPVTGWRAAVYRYADYGNRNLIPLSGAAVDVPSGARSATIPLPQSQPEGEFVAVVTARTALGGASGLGRHMPRVPQLPFSWAELNGDTGVTLNAGSGLSTGYPDRTATVTFELVPRDPSHATPAPTTATYSASGVGQLFTGLTPGGVYRGRVTMATSVGATVGDWSAWVTLPEPPPVVVPPVAPTPTPDPVVAPPPSASPPLLSASLGATIADRVVPVGSRAMLTGIVSPYRAVTLTLQRTDASGTSMVGTRVLPADAAAGRFSFRLPTGSPGPARYVVTATGAGLVPTSAPAQDLSVFRVVVGTVRPSAPEFLRLDNTGPVAVHLRGWTLRDASGNKVTLPRRKLAAGAKLLVFSGAGKSTASRLYLSTSKDLWSRHDRAVVRDSRGVLVARRKY